MASVDGEVDDLVEGIGKIDLGDQQIEIEECWSDAKIICHFKEQIYQESLSKVQPQVLQFLVQKQGALLNKILKENSFCFDKQKSKKCLAILYLPEDKVTAEDIGLEFKNVCQAFTISCMGFDFATVQIEAAAWPFVYREFCQSMKQYLEDGNVQVIQRDENNYMVVGYINDMEKNAAVLKDLSLKCVVEKIENWELFEILQMQLHLRSENEHVDIQVQNELHQLVMRGEREKVKKCVRCYHKISNLDYLVYDERQISEHVHKFLTLRKVRQGVNDLLKRNGYRLYWKARKADSCFVLRGFGFTKTKVTAALEFLTKECVKEFRIAKSDLQADTLHVQKNAEVFDDEDGNLVLVYYGNVTSQVVAKDSDDIRFNDFEYSLKSEHAALLQRKVVQDFITAKLQHMPFNGRWNVDVMQQKIIIHCLKKEEADTFLAALQELLYTVPIDVNPSSERIKQFMSKHHERAAMGKGNDEDRNVICVTVDIKGELDDLLKEKKKDVHFNAFECRLRSERAELLQKKVVQDFIAAKLQHIPFTGKWSVDDTQQKIIIHCLKKEEADKFVAALLGLFYSVPIDVNSTSEHVKQFMSKHHERAAMGKGNHKDCYVICVTVDIKEELDNLLKEITKDVHFSAFEYRLRSEQAELLQKKVVQDFIAAKLQHKPFNGRWSVDDTQQKIIIHCLKKEEADTFLAALQELLYTVPIDVNPSSERIKQFMSKHHERAAMGKGTEEDCDVICVTVDLKEELDSLLEEMKREMPCNPGLSKRHLQNEKHVEDIFPLDAEVQCYLNENLKDKLDTLNQACGVHISSTQGGLLLKSESAEAISNAKKQLFDIVKNIAHKKEIIKIRRDIGYETVRKEIERTEGRGQCRISLLRNDVEEPQYYKSWINHDINVVIAEGDIENSVSDVLVCIIDENFEPVGRSAERIFKKGGWAVMNKAARLGKEENQIHVYLSSTTATLKCRRILFVCSKELRKDVEVVWGTFLLDASKSCWRSICFPVDDSHISDGSVEKLILTVAEVDTKKLRNRLEVVLCIPKSYGGRSSLENICQKKLSRNFFPITFSIYGLEQLESADKCLQSPIDIQIRVASILEVANEGTVDVIVNSTNCELKLDEGYVSKLILKHGGTEIQTQLRKGYQDGIGYGDIAVSSAGRLRCKKIIHGVLYPSWVSTGNFSLKVLESLVKKCLMAAERHGFSTIAFPALGTGNLAYPYINVARTMLKAVNDFGRQYPDTCINTVYIILHESEIECKETFENVFESRYQTFPYDAKELKLDPCMQFLENRLPERGLLIQLMSEENDELVDAVIKFSTSSSVGSHGARGPVNLTWCNSRGGYYTAEMLISHTVSTENLEKLVEMSFKMLEIKKVTSVRIDIKDIKEHHGLEIIMDQFCKKLSTLSFSRSLRTNAKEEGMVRYLRRLQILVSLDNYSKIPRQMKESDSWLMSKFTSLFKRGEQGIDWKEVKKKQTLEVVCCVLGPNKEEVEKALENVQKKVGIDSSETGRWCVRKDYKWKLVSNVCNDELNHAAENKCSEINVRDNDGTGYKYNMEEMYRIPLDIAGESKPEDIQCIHDEELIPLQPNENVWCVKFRDGKWRFLPMMCSEKLNNAAMSRDGHVTISSGEIDGQLYLYDINDMKRKAIKQVGSQKANHKEEIMMIHVEAMKTGVVTDVKDAPLQMVPQHFAEVKETEDQDDFTIFEYVTGVISTECNQETATKTKQEIRQLVYQNGCEIKSEEKSGFHIQGSLSQILKVNQQLTDIDKGKKRSSSDSADAVIHIPMSERHYSAFVFFGNKYPWYKEVANSIQHTDDALTCAVSVNKAEMIEKEMKEHLDRIKMMNSESIVIENKEIDVSQILKDVGENNSNIFLALKENTIELTCDSYEELQRVKVLLQQKASGKKARRAGRKFAVSQSEESDKKASGTGDVYRRRFVVDESSRQFSSDDNMNQTRLLEQVEIKTDESLVVKIYTGSITRLQVDCIVNAANENLMHGGGVAAAISEAAGYEFDEESKQYVARNGPIPVGSCGVTSAGKLSYKYVIHTVGPRWGDYRDKTRCLDDLCESVEVTFREADRLRMKSIALPAISSGIFAVPRDQCIEQYYRAVMTFSRIHPFKSLQEIHFVDRDSSMVGAIQEIFKQRRSSSYTPANQNPQLTDDDKLSSIHKKDQSNEQYGSTDSIINVSAGCLVKLHLGNITDAKTDVVVCPQDEYCSSNGQTAKAIFRMIPDKFSSYGRKKFGDVLPQNVFENSPWKMIIHAVTPRWNNDSAKDPQKFEKTLNIMIQEILKTADGANFLSIAIPLLGAGEGDYQTPVEICARNFNKAVKATHSEFIHLKEIHLVVKDEAAEKAYLDIFEEGGFKIIPKTILKTGKSMSGKDWGKTIKGSSQSTEQENCCICMDRPTNPKRLQKCGHIFCKECIEQCFEYKPACPSCGEFYGKVKGDQPPGSISMKKDYQRLEGFNDCRSCIIVTYTFHNGSQGPEHPNPGKWYKGIVRPGYIPNNERGRLVAKLLNVAFSRRLVFTIGHSRTTGQDGVITWNDIHHKTRPTGGPERFGYPDDTYLDRVLEELAAKGVTPESADDPLEYSEYSRFIKYYG